jgi:succinyl-CoA synthetase alpha subunit
MVDCLDLFFADPETKGIIIIGEIGGTEEEDAAEFILSRQPDVPIVGFIAGRHAPPSRQMGHAGTLTMHGTGDAQGKIEALRKVGVTIAERAHLVGATMSQALFGVDQVRRG